MTHTITLVLTDVEAQLIHDCALEQGVPVAEFVRRSALTMCVTLKPENSAQVQEVGGA